MNWVRRIRRVFCIVIVRVHHLSCEGPDVSFKNEAHLVKVSPHSFSSRKRTVDP